MKVSKMPAKMPAKTHVKWKRDLDDTVDVLVANNGREWHVVGEAVHR